MGRIEDDLSSIFENVREAALTMQQGGGIGHDFSTLRPKGAAGQEHRRRRLGAGQLHGRVGRHVPHHHVGGGPPRRDDGDAEVRPPGHRGLHRRQGRSGAPQELQPVGAGDRPLHPRRAQRRALAAHLRRQGLPHGVGARAVGPHDARHLRLRRARRRLHRSHQCPQQPRLLRDDQRHEPLRARRHMGPHQRRAASGPRSGGARLRRTYRRQGPRKLSQRLLLHWAQAGASTENGRGLYAQADRRSPYQALLRHFPLPCRQ